MIYHIDPHTKPQEATVDIFSKLPFFKSNKTDAPEVPLEANPEQVKKDRIAFHRDHVRNGPTKFKEQSSGQERRANRRSLARRTKKARKAQVRTYFANQSLAASVRGHLQQAGVLAYVVPRELDAYKQVVSTAWLVTRFGTELTDDEGEPTGAVSFKHDDVLVALAQALRFYGQVVGLPGLQVPEDYIVPVYERDDIAPVNEVTV